MREGGTTVRSQVLYPALAKGASGRKVTIGNAYQTVFEEEAGISKKRYRPGEIIAILREVSGRTAQSGDLPHA
jgi:hypothetical protein